MNRKLTVLSLAVVTAVTLSGCSAGGAKASSDSAAPATTQGAAQGNGRNRQAAADPELQALLQEQQQDQQQIAQLLQQIDADAGLPAPAAPDHQQVPPGGGGQGNGSGPRQGGNRQQGGSGGQQPGGATEQDMQAAKDLIDQEHQAAADLIAKLTTFDGLVKQAAGNQKALADAKAQWESTATSLESVRGRGFFGGNRGPNGTGGGNTDANSGNGNSDDSSSNNAYGGGFGSGARNLGQGLQNRVDLYKGATTKLEAAITQVKSDLGQ